MKTSRVLALLEVALVGVACNSTTGVQTNFEAALTGAFEVPALTSPSTGIANATLTINGLTISYTLTMTAAAASNYTAAHIHAGTSTGGNTPAGVGSGVVRVNLCGAGTAPPCPTGTGTVTSSFTADSNNMLLGSSAQITYAAFVTAIRNRLAYVNVHSVGNPGGEIRGQILATEQPK